MHCTKNNQISLCLKGDCIRLFCSSKEKNRYLSDLSTLALSSTPAREPTTRSQCPAAAASSIPRCLPKVDKHHGTATYQTPSLCKPTIRGGGGMQSPGLAKNAEKCGKECGKCGKKCDRKCGFIRMVFSPQNPYVSSRLAQSGAQSMNGLKEQLSTVVQLKNITD